MNEAFKKDPNLVRTEYKLVHKGTKKIVASGNKKEMHNLRKKKGDDHFVGLSTNKRKVGDLWEQSDDSGNTAQGKGSSVLSGLSDLFSGVNKDLQSSGAGMLPNMSNWSMQKDVLPGSLTQKYIDKNKGQNENVEELITYLREAGSAINMTNPDEVISVHNNMAKRKGVSPIPYGTFGKKVTPETAEYLAARLERLNGIKDKIKESHTYTQAQQARQYHDSRSRWLEKEGDTKRSQEERKAATAATRVMNKKGYTPKPTGGWVKPEPRYSTAGRWNEEIVRRIQEAVKKDSAYARFWAHDPETGQKIKDFGKKEREEAKAFKSAKKEINRLKKKGK